MGFLFLFFVCFLFPPHLFVFANEESLFIYFLFFSLLQQLYQTLSDFDIRFYMYEILKVGGLEFNVFTEDRTPLMFIEICWIHF